MYRINSDHLNASSVTSDLEIQPTEAFNKGEKYLGKIFDTANKKPKSVWKHYPFGTWRLDSKMLLPQKKRVEDHIGYLLEILEPHAEQITKYLNQKENYEISFYIRWEPYDGHGSFTISSELLERMKMLSHFVEFSFLS